MMTMTMQHHQSLKLPLLALLLVLVVLVVNLPCCRTLCDISAARQAAHDGLLKEINPQRKYVVEVAKRAAKQAKVISPSVIEAYKCKV